MRTVWRDKVHKILLRLAACISWSSAVLFALSITLNIILGIALWLVVSQMTMQMAANQEIIDTYKENRDLRVQYEASVRKYCDLQGKIADTCQGVLGRLSADLGLSTTAPAMKIVKSVGPYIPPVTSVGGPEEPIK